MGISLATGLTRDQIDPLRSPVLRHELPGLATALDEQAMRDRLQALLFGPESPYQIERCNPGQAIYLAGDFCGLRYELELRDRDSGSPVELLVIGRVFQQRAACSSFMRDRLAPVAAAARGRADLAPLARLAAPIEALNMVVHAFPVDGELPILVDVTDPQRAVELIGPALAESFRPERCQVQLAHYGRQHRCTLRYTLDGTDEAGAPAQRVVYGKVAADGSGARTALAVAALRERLQAVDDGGRLGIPRALGFLPELQLLLLEAIPGKPQVARLLKARLAGEAGPSGPLTLERAMGACGEIAAALHRSGIALGRPRSLDAELGWLARSAGALGRVSPELGARLQGWIQHTAAAARRTDPLPLCFSHGDFTYTQIIFDGERAGLVDFDTICQAEPALDLGQFLAYQRLAILKDQRPEAPLTTEAVEQLCAAFLDAYMAAMDASASRRRKRDRNGERVRLRARIQIYELLMLLRLAIHSWQKLKLSRLEHAITLIEERSAWLD